MGVSSGTLCAMPRTVLELDTPFRPGEKVVSTQDLQGVPEGTRGKVKLVNGLQTWIRYWVKFDNGPMIGQLSQNQLVRPTMVDAWNEREAQLALVGSTASTSAAATPAAESGDGDASGAAGLIPAAILERSKAAKARLLG